MARPAIRRAIGWLRLGAAPSFALMALVSGVGGGQPDVLCSPGHLSALSGMVVMYALMSVFHLPPWLALVSGRRNGADRFRGFAFRFKLGPGRAEP